MTPGAFEAGGPYTLFVKPIPDGWSAEDTTSFLEEYNNYYMDFMAVQKIFPGTFAAAYLRPQGPLRHQAHGRQPGAPDRAGPSSSRTRSWRAATATTTCACASTSSSSCSRRSSSSRWTSTSTRAPGPRTRSSNT
ncbi:MAG: hypothetical protein M0C28_00555 [Candidatus Moduliflexus flocculans]|nr:hypothetical protein [Candidatus Moduliflexus flocculans]